VATVESWFADWVGRFVEIVPRQDWPMPDSEYWEVVKRGFIRQGVNLIVAEEASQRLAEEPPPFLDRMLPELLAKSRTIFKENESSSRSASNGSETDRLDAEAASQNCDRAGCGGKSGLTILYRHQSAVQGENNEVVFYCNCAMGQWIAAAHRKGSDEAARSFSRRMPNLIDHRELWADEFRSPPYFGPVEPFDPKSFKHRSKLADIGVIPNVA